MAESARYEISVDDVVRTHRDSLEIATEAANVLQASKPFSNVVVSDLLTGKLIEAAASLPFASVRGHSAKRVTPRPPSPLMAP